MRVVRGYIFLFFADPEAHCFKNTMQLQELAEVCPYFSPTHQLFFPTTYPNKGPRKDAALA